jgi:hypothetical protein
MQDKLRPWVCLYMQKSFRRFSARTTISINLTDAVKIFHLMTQGQIITLLDPTCDAAADGRFEPFTTTTYFDGTANAKVAG